MSLVGFGNINVGAMAQVNIGSRALEVALVLDTTGSMGDHNKLVNLKIAGNDMIDALDKMRDDKTYLKVGVVPFAASVNVGLDHRNESWIDVAADDAGFTWEGCVGAREAPEDTDIHSGKKYPGISIAECPRPILPLTDDLTQVKASIDNLVAEGNTYIPAGLLWGWNILDDSKPFDEALSKGKRAKLGGKRVVVLITDGMLTQQVTEASLPGNEVCGSKGFPPCDKSTAYLKNLCQSVKADQIQIYTIAFQIEDLATKQMLADCADVPEMAFDASNGDELKAAFATIARKLSALHLTQ
jgi:hypothetical protein